MGVQVTVFLLDISGFTYSKPIIQCAWSSSKISYLLQLKMWPLLTQYQPQLTMVHPVSTNKALYIELQQYNYPTDRGNTVIRSVQIKVVTQPLDHLLKA
jgi:hypothetical protein